MHNTIQTSSSSILSLKSILQSTLSRQSAV